MSVQLFVKAPGDLTYRRLDLFPTEPIKLTLSVANIEDPLAANSVFSRTFKVPHTGQNGPFFKAAFNVNSTDFDASKKADAYINDNGIFFALGNIRLLSIYVNEKQDDVQYEINFYGETSDFGSKIGGGFLSEVNLSAYNHSLTYNNVVNSWSGGLLGGNVVYPLIEWGYLYTSAGVPQPRNNTMSIGGVASFTTASEAINFPQLKPTLKAKALWDAIFNETGYTYESTFLESDPLFTGLFVVAENEARALISADISFNADDFGATNDVGTGIGSGIPYIVDMQFPNEIIDPANAYNPTTSHYTAETPGTFTFEVSGYVEGVWSNPAANTAVLFKIVDVNTGTVLSTTSPQAVLQGPQSFTKSLSAVLTLGQVVKLQVEGIGPVAPVNTSYITFFSCNWYTTSVPSTVAMSSFMPTNIRKIDFMRSIINRFRLVFVPSKDNEKHFEITPWKDWILQGTQKDWTTMLDGSKDMKIKPLFYGQERLQVYKDQEDADFVNYGYQLDYKQTYGQLNLDSNNELIKGTKVIQDQFAPTPLYPIGGTDPSDAAYAFLIPHLAKDTDTERQPIQPKLRLLYYNGLQPSPITWYINSNWNPVSQTGSVPVSKNSYPLMSQFSTWPVSVSTFDLNWENELPLYDTETSGLSKNISNYSCFNVFWKTWYDTMFDPFSRIVEANFILSYQDILELKFNDYIFVKDAWYLVNKVTDYVIGSETNCRVELVKVGGNIGLVIPPNTTVYKQKELCFGNTACEAYCCTFQVGQYFTNDILFANSTVIYNDALGSIPAPDGYYSDGTTTVQTVNGVIIQYLNPICNCNPPDLYPYTVCVGTTSCEAYCCEGASITVWGTSSTDLASSANVYLDSAGTIPANGWYAQTGSPYSVNVINGVTWAIGVGSFCNCNPIIVYPHQVVFKSTEFALCDVCCETLEQTVYSDTVAFGDSTVIYIDNVPLTRGGAAYWKQIGSNDVLITDADGDVISTATCTGCSCDYHYVGENCEEPTLLARFTSPTPLNIGDVVDSLSYSNQCWVIIEEGTTPGEPVDNVYETCEECAGPPVPCECYDYEISSLTGGAISYIDCDTEEVMYMDIAPSTSYLVCACQYSVIPIFGKITIVERGECGADIYYPLDAEYFGNEASGCTVCCDTDGTPITIYGNTETMATSTVVFGDAEGTTMVLPGYYKDRSGNTYYVDTLGNLSFFNCGVCPPCGEVVYVNGNFASYDGISSNGIIAINGDTGEKLSAFDVGIGFSRTGSTQNISSKTLIHDNGLYVVGNFTHYKGVPVNGIVKLDFYGNIDPTFNAGTGFTSGTTNQPLVSGIAALDDNRIIVTGSFRTYNSTDAWGVICLFNDGTRDNSFVVGTGTQSNTAAPIIIAIRDGKIYLNNLQRWKGVNYTVPVVVMNASGTVELSYQSFDKRSNLVMDSQNRIYSLTLESGNYRIRRFLETGLMDGTYIRSFVFVDPPTITNVTLAVDAFDNLYVQTFNTASINGVQYRGIAKLDPNGDRIIEFDEARFNPNASYSAAGSMVIKGDVLYYYGFYQPNAFYGFPAYAIGAIVKMSAINGDGDTNFTKRILLTSSNTNGSVVNITTN
jgi:hypothetical protein